MNGFTWEGDGSDSLWTVYPDTYEEFVINAARHPVHIHVNPMQVQTDQDAWNQPGDWMDVILSSGTYRQHLADHAGTVIVHCHWLTHEDLGCMSQFSIADCPTDINGAIGTCSTEETAGSLQILANELGMDVVVIYILITMAVILVLALAVLGYK